MIKQSQTDYSKKYIEAVIWCGKLYDFINDKFFESTLSKPVITVSACERNKALGWFIYNEVWKEDKNDKGVTEINISSNFLHRSPSDIAETMLHEMCHQYAFANNIQDCSRSGKYHNKLFAKIAEMHGLAVEKLPKIGYSGTMLTENSKQTLQPFVENVKLIYRIPFAKGAKIQSSSTRKYVCPTCELSVRATKAVNIICADCNKPMIEDN